MNILTFKWMQSIGRYPFGKYENGFQWRNGDLPMFNAHTLCVSTFQKEQWRLYCIQIVLTLDQDIIILVGGRDISKATSHVRSSYFSFIYSRKRTTLWFMADSFLFFYRVSQYPVERRFFVGNVRWNRTQQFPGFSRQNPRVQIEQRYLVDCIYLEILERRLPRDVNREFNEYLFISFHEVICSSDYYVCAMP